MSDAEVFAVGSCSLPGADAGARGAIDLPWERVRKEYAFEGCGGRETLADLFGMHSQLIVYHLGFDPDRRPGGRGRLHWIGRFDGIAPIEPQGAALVAVSRAPLQRLQSCSARFGWTFKWVSSAGSDFDLDHSVLLPAVAGGQKPHSQAGRRATGTELRGINVFFRTDGHIFRLPGTSSERASSAYSPAPCDDAMRQARRA